MRSKLNDDLEIAGYEGLAAFIDLNRMTNKQKVAILEMDDLLEESFIISSIDVHGAKYAIKALALQLKNHFGMKIDIGFK